MCPTSSWVRSQHLQCKISKFPRMVFGILSSYEMFYTKWLELCGGHNWACTNHSKLSDTCKPLPRKVSGDPEWNLAGGACSEPTLSCSISPSLYLTSTVPATICLCLLALHMPFTCSPTYVDTLLPPTTAMAMCWASCTAFLVTGINSNDPLKDNLDKKTTLIKIWGMLWQLTCNNQHQLLWQILASFDLLLLGVKALGLETNNGGWMQEEKGEEYGQWYVFSRKFPCFEEMEGIQLMLLYGVHCYFVLFLLFCSLSVHGDDTFDCFIALTFLHCHKHHA